MRILSECGGKSAAPKHMGVRQPLEARCGHVTGNVVENLQIGFDFTFFDNILRLSSIPQQLGSGMGLLRPSQKERRRRSHRRVE